MTEPCITVFESLEKAETAWRDLERDGCCYVFQAYDWTRLWHETAGVRREYVPCPVLIELPPGQPLLLLPLAVRKLAGIRVLTWLGNEMAEYLGPLLARDFDARIGDHVFADIWQRVLKRLPQHDLVLFERQPTTIGDVANPFATLPHSPHSANAHFTAIGHSLETFLKSRRSSRSLTTERRKHKRLNEQGELAFVVVDTAEKLSRFLPEMMAQKSHSYMKMGVTDLFSLPENREYVEQLSKCRPQFVSFFALTLDDETLATLWGLNHSGRFYHLFPTYARNGHAVYAPGNVLLRYVFEWCIDNGIEIYDFTVGDESYKSHWCDRDLELFDTIRASTLRGWVPALAVWTTRWAKRKIKSSPRMFALARRLRAAR